MSDLAPRPYALMASAEGYYPEVKGYTPSPIGPAQIRFALRQAANNEKAV
ncbi:MAG: hypothetical protein HYX78_08105 [Armatimonadetes bacterium]|nr:hypothetical protein [Armatimonadota bacterium]